MFHGYSKTPEFFPMNCYAPLDDPTPPDDMVQFPLLNLPTLSQRFFVPPLTDKPQNPIMDALKHDNERLKAPILLSLPPELELLAVDPPPELRPRDTVNDFWSEALTRKFVRSKALSWDRLRASHPTQASSTGFLSEQDDLVFSAARYSVNPRLRDPLIDMVYVTQRNVLNALKMTVLGTSSVYHTWDSKKERFVQAGVGDGKKGFILIDGKDEVVSQSLLSRFLSIGTLLRRLETFLSSLRARSAQEGPTVHAYTHALATIIMFLRQDLARSPPANYLLITPYTLSAIWAHHEIYEDTFASLAELYGRDERMTPEEYPAFNPSPVTLLSSIYAHLDRHIERQSPRFIIAIFAFVLTIVSREYFQQLSQSVGYGSDTVKKVSRVTGEVLHQYTVNDAEEEREGDLFESLEHLEDTFPDFFPPSLLDILPAAQRSLVLLERAQPEHPMLRRTVAQGAIEWFWTEPLVEAASRGHYTVGSNEGTDTSSGSTAPPVDVTGQYDELSIFRLFDLEPGANRATTTALAKAQTTTQSLQSFIDEFPASLPPLTPTLSHLTSLVLAPLLDHASILSSALLELFLTPSTTSQDTLNFEAHLTLLRSYLLLTAPPFKARLAAALFSDWEPGEFVNKAHGLALQSLRRKPSNEDAEGDSAPEQVWAVGLAPSLLERKTWPPVGADLSYFLRTVIVDSIENGGGAVRRVSEERVRVKSRVLEEADYRLGFAIRDLPTGSGRDKWLNPLSIEALDFLYMDYKPPAALEVLITPETLLKYQRMFAFILRLMRVEHALASLFRMTRSAAQPLFLTLTEPRKALLHFRFVAQSFVTSLSTYVFDTAISGNFDPFLARLSVHGKDEDGHEARPAFSDVFTLAKSHSALLDNMLSACLLRSGQRAVGEVLRSALELILEFTVVVGQLYRKHVEEYEAASLLDDISKKFFGKIATLTKVLKGLADKNGSLESAVFLQNSNSAETPRRPTGGADALFHLLVRLDLGDWWATARRESCKSL